MEIQPRTSSFKVHRSANGATAAFPTPSQLQGEVQPNLCSMWFIGLVFEKSNVNVDLTYDIKSFTKAVHYQAEHTNMLREGMTIEVITNYASTSIRLQETIYTSKIPIVT